MIGSEFRVPSSRSGNRGILNPKPIKKGESFSDAV